mgnify:CR=1 FL=1
MAVEVNGRAAEALLNKFFGHEIDRLQDEEVVIRYLLLTGLFVSSIFPT